jgi:hypothetical protein
MRASGDLPFEYLYRHIHGDWGQLEQADVWENELGLIRGFRLVSAYTLKSGVKIYIITEAVNDDGFRESTCILLPEEY